MIAIQLIGVLIGVTAIYFTYLYYKRANFVKKELFLWCAIWVGFLVVTIFPQIMWPFVGYLGLSRSMDIIMIIAFIILFSIVFHNYTITHRMVDKLEKLVRDQALEDLKK